MRPNLSQIDLQIIRVKAPPYNLNLTTLQLEFGTTLKKWLLRNKISFVNNSTKKENNVCKNDWLSYLRVKHNLAKKKRFHLVDTGEAVRIPTGTVGVGFAAVPVALADFQGKEFCSRELLTTVLIIQTIKGMFLFCIRLKAKLLKQKWGFLS